MEGLISDNEDEAVQLLRQIAANTGDLGSLDSGDDIDIQGQSVTSRVGVIDPSSYVVLESDDLDDVDDSEAVTIQPGETEAIVRYESQVPFAVLAVGATDEAGVSYRLEADNQRTIANETNSPLGLLNSPFSFVDKVGGAVSCESSCTYYATLDPSAPSPVDVAGRLHVEVI